jgi:uncharacterized protein YabE (DUF348 family)
MQILTRARSKLFPYAHVAAGLLALAGLAVLYHATARPVTLIVDGRVVGFRTHARTVAAALRQAGFEAVSGDSVSPSLDSPLEPNATIELIRARQVLVEVEGQARWVLSAGRNPANVLAAGGVFIYPGDRLWVDGLPVRTPGAAVGQPASRLRLEKAVTIALETDGGEKLMHSAAPTLGEALWEAGLVLYEGDRLNPGPETPLRPGMRARLRRSRPVTVHVDGALIESRAIGGTVGEALAETGVALVGLDYAEPGLNEPLPKDGQIRVVRVREQVLTEQKPVPFDKVYEPLPDLEIDNLRVLEPGAYGVVSSRVRVRLEDGDEVSRVVEGEWVARQPQPRVIGYGTLVIPRTLNTADGPIQYCRLVSMYATSYSPSRAGTPEDAPWYGITRSGKPLTKGLVAIDRSLIPFGTMMYVEGYGFAEAADTGGGVKGRWIDLGYDDDNYTAWHKWVSVYFVCPLPAGIAWIFP